MKKQFFVVSSLLLVSGLYAANMNEVLHKMADAQRQVFNEAFGVNHNRAMNSWDDVFIRDIKAFVIDNSKDLVGKQDPIIMNTMRDLETIKLQFRRALDAINANLAKAPISRLLPIATDARKLYDKIYAANFTLGSKKNAREILLNVARFFEDASKKLYDKLLIKGELPPKAPSRPLPAIPGK